MFLAATSVDARPPAPPAPVPEETFHDVVIPLDPTPVVTLDPTPSPTPVPPKRTVEGSASWYADGPGLYAAAGPALRIGAWRGRTVSVCTKTACVRVILSDWCACYPATSRERIIDLSPAAFAVLAPLSRGIVAVTVRW